MRRKKTAGTAGPMKVRRGTSARSVVSIAEIGDRGELLAESADARETDTSVSAELSGGDVDARWDQAESSGEETVGGSVATPDQDIVDEIGASLGVQYNDDEELKAVDKIEERDRNRWELDPASSDDYRDRTKK